VSQFNVHTAAAGPLGADVDCVHVCPASAVDKKVPIRCEGELELVPLAVGASPLTLKTQ
jgi:predicted ArsR family transcriptional regulator